MITFYYMPMSKTKLNINLGIFLIGVVIFSSMSGQLPLFSLHAFFLWLQECVKVTREFWDVWWSVRCTKLG